MMPKAPKLNGAIEAVIEAIDDEWPLVLRKAIAPNIVIAVDEHASSMEGGNPLDIFDTEEIIRAQSVTQAVVKAIQNQEQIKADWSLLDESITLHSSHGMLLGLIVGFAGGLRTAGISRKETKRRLWHFLENFREEEEICIQEQAPAH